MFDIEKRIYDEGYDLIACIDEVGRGCLAGDVVACAVIMPKDMIIDGVKDSKKLTAKRREELYYEIIENSIALGIGQVGPETIDRINIKESTRLAMKKAVLNIKDKENIRVIPDYLLIDAESVPLDISQTSLVKGDEISHGIACASIVAKVYRDKLCQTWDKQYQGYNIYKNKGYGTKEHREAIKLMGPSPIHRLSFLGNILEK